MLAPDARAMKIPGGVNLGAINSLPVIEGGVEEHRGTKIHGAMNDPFDRRKISDSL
jgi:hypothetical protein